MWRSIRRVLDGKPGGEPIGTLHLKAGDHRDVKVPLKHRTCAGSALWTAVYQDKDGDMKLDKSKDAPFWSVTEIPADGKFIVADGNVQS